MEWYWWIIIILGGLPVALFVGYVCVGFLVMVLGLLLSPWIAFIWSIIDLIKGNGFHFIKQLINWLDGIYLGSILEPWLVPRD